MWLSVTPKVPLAPQSTPWSPDEPVMCVTETLVNAIALGEFVAVPGAVAAVYSQNAAPPEPVMKHRTRASVTVTVPPLVLVARIETDGVVPAAREHSSMTTTASVSVQLSKVSRFNVAEMLVALEPVGTVAAKDVELQ
jgi:hypothetical protein